MATPTVTPTTPRGLVVVTGGSGYIAGYCIAQLLNEGWRVRTTVRNLGRAEEVRATIGKIAANAGAIEFVAADLNSDAGWANAVAGADYVLHVASPVPAVDPKTDDELVRPARDGTLRVLKAARDAGVKRVVMTSSISAIIVRPRECVRSLSQRRIGLTRRTATTHPPMIGQRQSPSAQRGHGTKPKAGRSNSSPSTPAWFSAPFSGRIFPLRLRRSGSCWTARYRPCRAFGFFAGRRARHRGVAIAGDDHALGCGATLHRLVRFLLDGRHRQNPQTGVGRQGAEGSVHFRTGLSRPRDRHVRPGCAGAAVRAGETATSLVGKGATNVGLDDAAGPRDHSRYRQEPSGAGLGVARVRVNPFI